MKLRVIFALSLLLSGCAGSPLERSRNAKSADDFMGLSDDGICMSFLDTNVFAVEARARRQLGDCTKSYRECKGYGLDPQDPNFVDCRMKYDAIEKISRRAAQRTPYVIPQTSSTPSTTLTTCRQSYAGSAIYCNSF